MLTFRFIGKCGQMTVPEKLVSGTIGKQVLLEFSPDWDGLKKTAVFMALDGSSHAACSVDVSQELLTIPAAVLTNPEHTLYVQIQGYSADGTEVINTGRIQGPRILPGIDSEELPEIDAKNPIWFDILAWIGDVDALETDSKSSLVSAINELALNKERNDIFQVALQIDDENCYHASATYMEIAHAHASGMLVLLKYGVYITHILAGEPTENSFLFEPILHSIPGIHGYIVDSQGNWTDAPVAGTDSGEIKKEIFTVTLESTTNGQYSANSTYMEIAHAHATGMLVLLKYGVHITHILAGEPAENSFLFEPILHSIPGIHGYIVDIQDNWRTAPITEPDTGDEEPAWSGYDTMVYGVSGDGQIYKAVMRGYPIYCLYDDLYYLPLMSWDEGSHTAIFGGCYGDTVITCTAVAGNWSVEVKNADISTAVNAALAQAKVSGEFDGEDGVDGVSPTVELEARENGIAISVASYQPGIGMVGATYLVKHGETGPQGPKGESYTLTDSDKSEIAAAVIESLGGNPVFGYVDENNNIVVSGNLPDGSYSVKYEMENGSTVNIGNLVLDSNMYYTITNNLTNCVSSNSATKAVQGGSYSATIAAKSGYELSSVKVTMGGTDISSTAVNGGNIRIANVTGNIVITAEAEETVVEIINQIPLSTDASGNLFNSGQGWKTGYRLGGDGTEKALSGIEVTGFIPISYGDTIYMKNITDDGTHIMGVYNSSRVKIGTRTFTNIFDGAVSGELLNMTINNLWSTETTSTSGVAYLRVSANEITANSIITVNKPIV